MKDHQKRPATVYGYVLERDPVVAAILVRQMFRSGAKTVFTDAPGIRFWRRSGRTELLRLLQFGDTLLLNKLFCLGTTEKRIAKAADKLAIDGVLVEVIKPEVL